MNLIKTSIFVLTLVAVSCCSSKKTTTEVEGRATETAEMKSQEMMKNGFKSGTIVASTAEGDCPFTIQMEGEETYFLDPINLEEAYKNNGEKIWFKFSPLRMMNRCDKANPVSITEIQKREE